FDDEGLSTLEKIYLFSRSQANFHNRVFITHAMPSILPQVSAVEAVEYVLPLLNGLAMDEDEGVKEALATELVPIIWWFSSNCRLTDDEMADPTEDPTPLLVQAFTPILGTLLLSPSAPVGAAARLAIVEILRRVRDADAQVANVDSGIEIFGVHERRLLEQEILQQVVIGIGRLDIPDEGEDVPMDVDAQVISHELDGGSDHESHPASGHRPRSPPAHLPLPISPPLLATIVDVSPDFTPPELTPDAATLSPPSPPSPIPPPQPFRIASPASKSGNDTAGEQAAVGRLSSMSLMAAVSASGYLEDSTKAAFVREVERVSRDPVYWVRKEASYALGALAKVVPVEVVHIALLPLFDSLSTDSVWNVRHSALFALPAILSRLSPQERRTLALRTILPLANDSSLAVRLRVLEALGEVIYSFRDDPGGPPDPVLRLFLGKFSSPVPQSSPLPEPVHSPERPPGDEPEDPSFDEPARPLICAFNLPAVALTLGHERWGELRPLYEFLAQCEAMKVRRTLAASVGEMARIVGPMHAARDMFPMWRAAMGAPEVEVRLKAVGALESLIGALASEERPGVLSIVEERWDTRALGWKEREALAGGLVGLVIQVGEPLSGRVSALVRRALEDEVAAVREAGVRSLPIMYQVLTGARHVWEQLSADVREMAHSSIFRRRMTFVACYQALLTANGYQMIVEDSPYRYCLAQLSEDPIIDVRIGVARLVGTIYNQFIRSGLSFPQPLDEILQRLQADAAPGVRAYVPAVPTQDFGAFPDSFATFSRPPPTPA
ncbi:ARM repeat-containing protein, partial [Artomyces pyxidatus]